MRATAPIVQSDFVRGMVSSLLLLTTLLGSIRAEAQASKLEIADLSMGFKSSSRQVIRPGCWLPIVVEIKNGPTEIRGIVELTAPDSDGLNTSLFQPVYLAPGERKLVHHSVKYGGADSEVTATLRDENGRTLVERTIQVSDGFYDPLLVNQKLLLTLGGVMGLAEGVADPGVVPDAFRVGRATTIADLPVQWFAYGAVECLILSTQDRLFFDNIDPARRTALQTWVRQGGRLVVSVADNWQLASSSFLGGMLPAKLTGLTTARAPDALEIFANAKSRLEANVEGLPVAEISAIRGVVAVEGGGRPMVITGNYGLGTVTLLTFDVQSGPFSTWEGKSDFWIKLLGIPRTTAETEEEKQRLQYSYYGISEIGSLLSSQLESFPDVTVVPFGIVALLIFGYILLIGPIDYFFLKKVVGRLELTWITFPTIVLAVSVGAYFAAHWLKGDDLRINRIDFVDVDVPSQTLRGTSFSALFSPQIARYTLAMEPDLAAGGAWSDLGMGAQQPGRMATWFGLPEVAYRGNYGQGSASLLGRRGYAYHDADASALEEVPIQVWSVKTFENHWLAQAAPTFEAKLTAADSGVEGTIANRLGKPLQDVLVFYGDFVQSIGRMDEDAEIDLATVPTRTIRDFLDVSTVNQDQQPNNSDRRSVVLSMLFSELIPNVTQRLPNNALRELDLSRHLALGRILVLARVEAPAGRLWLGALPAPETTPPAIDGIDRAETYLRVLIDPQGDK